MIIANRHASIHRIRIWSLIVLAAVVGVSSIAQAQEKKDTSTTRVKSTKDPEAKKKAAAESAASVKAAVEKKKAAAKIKKAAADTGDSNGSATMVIENPVHDFGEVWTVPTLAHTFIVKNTGTNVLKITNVKPGCGCTIKGAYDREIQPGATGKIPLTLRTKGKTNFSTNITVSSNDSSNPTTRVTLKGNIKYYVEANPRNVRFNRIQTNETVKQNVTIKVSSDDANLELVAGGKSGNFQGTLTPTDDPKKFQLTVVGTPPFKEGSTSGYIRIKTNIKEQPELQIPIAAFVAPRLEIRPKQIYVPSAMKKKTPRIIMFKNNGDSPVEVLSATVSNPAVTAEVREVKKGRDYQITVQLPEGYLPPTAGDKLLLKLLDGTERTHEIPIISRPVRKSAKNPRKPRRRPAMDLLGKPAPEITLAMHDGKKTAVPSNEKVTVIEFYTSWCGFCKRSMPLVEQVYQEFKDNPNVQIIAVSQDTRGSTPRDRTEEQVIDTFFKERGFNFGLALDPAKVAGTQYKATSYPTLFVVGKTGKVEAVHVGAKKDLAESLKKDIETLLSGKSLIAPKKPDEAKKTS